MFRTEQVFWKILARWVPGRGRPPCVKSTAQQKAAGRGSDGFALLIRLALNTIVSARGRCLLITLLRILLIRLVASDNASGNRADFTVPGHMASEASDD